MDLHEKRPRKVWTLRRVVKLRKTGWKAKIFQISKLRAIALALHSTSLFDTIDDDIENFKSTTATVGNGELPHLAITGAQIFSV